MSGYDNFFKQAQKNKKTSRNPRVRTSGDSKRARNKKALKQNRASQPKSDAEVEHYLRQAFMPKKARKKAPQFSLKLLSLGIFGLLVTSYGFLNTEKILELMDSVEVSSMPRAIAAEGQEKNAEAKGERPADVAAKSAKQSAEENPVDNNWTNEDLSYFSKLRERKRSLDLKEKELNELEAELHKQKSEIEERIAKLEEIRRGISSVLNDKVVVDQEKVKKLVEFYSNMKPQQAAEIITNLNEDLAVEVLGRMKKKNAANIMNLLAPKKARTLSEKFAGYQRR